MADNESFFRKVVRFVANPATEWSELGSRHDDGRELELERSELKAMIERKRRNDFVRKREFDMLRKVRREGLTPEQLAALGSSSRLDDSEARAADGALAAPSGVKAKIDAIEQQMVGSAAGQRSRPGAPYDAAAPTPPSSRDGGASTGSARFPGSVSGTAMHGSKVAVTGEGAPPAFARSRPPLPVDIALPVAQRGVDPPPSGFDWPLSGSGSREAPAAGAGGASGVGPAPARTRPAATVAPPLPPADTPPPTLPVHMGTGLPPLAPLSAVTFEPPGLAGAPGVASPFVNPFQVQVSEVVHDPELDEAVIAFANADFRPCEDALRRLTASGGARAQHAETWLVLFDLYRATGQQQRFESLALDYAQQFGWSAPQWYSLPQLVADAARDDEPAPLRNLGPTTGPAAAEAGWVCPPQLDIEAVGRLRAQTLQMPLPWVLDWRGLRQVDVEAAMQLSSLLRLWAGQALEMRWIDGERLPMVLHEAAPTGSRNADPVYWLTRLEVLRLINRADRFDEVAIDYCMTYEVSPPSWEAARCRVTLTDEAGASAGGPWSAVSDMSTGFLESSLLDDGSGIEIARVELAGQLVGDIGDMLEKIRHTLAQAAVVQISCARLIRVDFIAAGDLLNWVLSRTAEQRAVQFVDAHRLVALFFGAMGINEHARVQVRKV